MGATAGSAGASGAGGGEEEVAEVVNCTSDSSGPMALPNCSGLAGRGEAGVELCDRCESSATLASSDTSCTAGRAPLELEDKMPTDRSDRDEPRTGKERSENEIAKEAALPGCRSGVRGGEVR